MASRNWTVIKIALMTGSMLSVFMFGSSVYGLDGHGHVPPPRPTFTPPPVRAPSVYRPPALPKAVKTKKKAVAKKSKKTVTTIKAVKTKAKSNTAKRAKKPKQMPKASSHIARVAKKMTGKKLDVANLQTSLNNLGYKPGKADGLYGNKTEAALKAWIASYKDPASRAFLNKLLQNKDYKSLASYLDGSLQVPVTPVLAATLPNSNRQGDSPDFLEAQSKQFDLIFHDYQVEEKAYQLAETKSDLYKARIRELSIFAWQLQNNEKKLENNRRVLQGNQEMLEHSAQQLSANEQILTTNMNLYSKGGSADRMSFSMEKRQFEANLKRLNANTLKQQENKPRLAVIESQSEKNAEALEAIQQDLETNTQDLAKSQSEAAVHKEKMSEHQKKIEDNKAKLQTLADKLAQRKVKIQDEIKLVGAYIAEPHDIDLPYYPGQKNPVLKLDAYPNTLLAAGNNLRLLNAMADSNELELPILEKKLSEQTAYIAMQEADNERHIKETIAHFKTEIVGFRRVERIAREKIAARNAGVRWLGRGFGTIDSDGFAWARQISLGATPEVALVQMKGEISHKLQLISTRGAQMTENLRNTRHYREAKAQIISLNEQIEYRRKLGPLLLQNIAKIKPIYEKLLSLDAQLKSVQGLSDNVMKAQFVVKNLFDKKFAALSGHEIDMLALEELTALSPEQLAALTPEKAEKLAPELIIEFLPARAEEPIEHELSPDPDTEPNPGSAPDPDIGPDPDTGPDLDSNSGPDVDPTPNPDPEQDIQDRIDATQQMLDGHIASIKQYEAEIRSISQRTDISADEKNRVIKDLQSNIDAQTMFADNAKKNLTDMGSAFDGYDGRSFEDFDPYRITQTDIKLKEIIDIEKEVERAHKIIDATTEGVDKRDLHERISDLVERAKDNSDSLNDLAEQVRDYSNAIYTTRKQGELERLAAMAEDEILRQSDYLERAQKTVFWSSVGVGASGAAAISAAVAGGSSIALTLAQAKGIQVVFNATTGAIDGYSIDGLDGAIHQASEEALRELLPVNTLMDLSDERPDGKLSISLSVLRDVGNLIGLKEMGSAGLDKVRQIKADLFKSTPTPEQKLIANAAQQAREQGANQVSAWQKAQFDYQKAKASGRISQTVQNNLANATKIVDASDEAKLILKNTASNVQRQFIEAQKTVIKDPAKKIWMEEMLARGWSEAGLRTKSVRNTSSAGTVGMDDDIALAEPSLFDKARGADKLKYTGPQDPSFIQDTKAFNNKFYGPNGKASRLQWQQDSKEAMDVAYHRVTGHSADASNIEMTTGASVEAYKDARLLITGETNQTSAKWAEQTASVAGYKVQKGIQAADDLGLGSNKGSLSNMSLSQVQQATTKIKISTRELLKDYFGKALKSKPNMQLSDRHQKQLRILQDLVVGVHDPASANRELVKTTGTNLSKTLDSLKGHFEVMLKFE